MKVRKRVRSISILLTIALVAMLAAPAVGMAAEPTVPLGTVQDFAVLSAATITNTGATTIVGDIGVSSGTAITGFDEITLDGAPHIYDDVAIAAHNDLIVAYDNASAREQTGPLVAVELGDLTFGPGVYQSADRLEITSTLTLDASGDPEAVFIFRSLSTLVTAPDSSVVLINGARFCRVFWVVPDAATLGTNSTFVGHIFAGTGIQAMSGARVEGQLLTRTGAVTLDNNVITNDWCAAAITPTTSSTTGTPRTVVGGQLPETATPWYNLLLASIAVLMLGAGGLSWTARRINA